MISELRKEELSKEITSYFEQESKQGSHCGFEVKVVWSDDKCRVKLSQMYDGIGSLCNFARMNWLSRLLGTEQINLENEDYQPGCETCDHGSSDSVDIVCFNCKPV